MPTLVLRMAAIAYTLQMMRVHREGLLRCHSRQSTGFESRDGPGNKRQERRSRLGASAGSLSVDFAFRRVFFLAVAGRFDCWEVTERRLSVATESISAEITSDPSRK